MSHIVSVQTKVHDPFPIAAACKRLGLAQPVQGTARLYAGKDSGLLLLLPGWQYPAVIDTSTGTVAYDNFQGRWGDMQHLEKFFQAYAVEKAKIEARRRGLTCTEQTLQDGSIKVQLFEGGT